MREGHSADQHGEATGGDGEAGAVVVLQADDGRKRQQRHQVHHLDQGVQCRARRVLERIADGVADDRSLVGVAALATVVAVFDVLLGIVQTPPAFDR